MLPLELDHLILFYLAHDQVLLLRTVSKRTRQMVNLYFVQRISTDPLFSAMTKSQLVHYIDRAKIVLDPASAVNTIDELAHSYQGLVPIKIYHGTSPDWRGVSFIDIDNNVYIESELVPHIKGRSLSCTIDFEDEIIYFIQDITGSSYVYKDGYLDQLSICFHKTSEVFALTKEGILMIFRSCGDDEPLMRIENGITRYTDLTAIVIDGWFCFLVYLKSHLNQHWMMSVDDCCVLSFVEIKSEKEIKSVAPSSFRKEEHGSFTVLFNDGSLDIMMIAIDTLAIHFVNVNCDDLSLSELEREFIYDEEGREYSLLDLELQPTGYSKWNSRYGEYMIQY